MYAILVNGCVSEVSEEVPAAGHMFMPCPDNVRSGWMLSGGVLVAPPAPPAPDPNAAINAAILDIENTVTQRRLREAALTEAGKVWLADVDAQIAALRKGLVYS